MSIADKIVETENYLRSAYTAIGEKNGIVPTKKNMSNLEEAIRSIQSNKPTLYAPSIALSNNILTISANDKNGAYVSKYNLFSNGSLIWTGDAPQNVSLRDLYKVEGIYTLKANAQGVNFNDSGFSNILNYTYENLPEKGDLITMNLDGTSRMYRVLKRVETMVEVLAMFEVNTSVKIQTMSSINLKYSGSLLDQYLNTTWYDTLTTVAKNAIVDKDMTQDIWRRDSAGSPVYYGYCGTKNPGETSYVVSLDSNASLITRHVYALSVQDVIDYITDKSVGDGSLQNYNIWKMFYNTNDTPSTKYDHWLRSASNEKNSRTGESYSFAVKGLTGSLQSCANTTQCACRPAFQIDLSKISFTVNS